MPNWRRADATVKPPIPAPMIAMRLPWMVMVYFRFLTG
jgi:hypothetical protein